MATSMPLRTSSVKFVDAGETIGIEDLRRHVRTLKGFIGENDITHVTFL